METKRAILISFAINLYFLLLCIIFGDLRFGAVDDWFMAGTLSGIFGSGNNVHLTFVNALYGYCLLPLYHFFPTINWYYIGEMASIFVSLTVIGCIIVKKVGEKWGSVFTVLLAALCASDFYLVLQFTQCASMLTAAGMLAFFYGLEKKEECSTKLWVVPMLAGTLLLWWGSWMRWPAFLMGMPFFATLLLLHIKKFRQIKIAVIVWLIVFIVGANEFHYFNSTLYATPDYKKYIDFQAPRSLLGDGQNYNHQAVSEDLDEIGFSGKDYSLLTNWNFYDNNVFSPESIHVVTEAISQHYYKPSFSSLPIKILATLNNSTKSPIFFVWFIFCLDLFFFKSSQRKWPWVSLIIVIILMSYLLNLQRFVYRVETGLWLYAGVGAISLMKKRAAFSNIIFFIIMASMVLFNFFSYATTGFQVRSPNTGELILKQADKSDSADFKGLFAYIDSASDTTFFMMSMTSYMRLTYHKFPPYLAEPKGSWEQILSFGFWTPYFPDIERAFRKRGISNPMKDVVLDNVFVIDEPYLVDFLERHYYNKVEIDTVRNFNGMVVYKYSIAGDSVAGVGE